MALDDFTPPPPPISSGKINTVWWRCCIIHRETFLFYRTNDPSSRGLQIIWFEITLIKEKYSCWYCAPVLKYFCVKFIKETKFFFFFGVHTAMTVANIVEKNMHTPRQRIVSKNTKIIIIVNIRPVHRKNS